MPTPTCCILNNGPGGWAFEALARRLSAALWLDIADVPREYNYLLHVENHDPTACGRLFIPYGSVQLASDKRLQARVFREQAVPMPETELIGPWEEVQQFHAARQDKEWCLKYPTGCGASGHRLLTADMKLSASWPHPFVVQEFIRLKQPEVYRLYAAGGEVFGWVARRFPAGTAESPWVAHARGARYELAGDAPAEAISAGRRALSATGLLDSFGCCDLLRRPSGEWVVLEVGTDGMFNHVDRDIGDPAFERELDRRVAEAFWAPMGGQPWVSGGWSPRELNREERQCGASTS